MPQFPTVSCLICQGTAFRSGGGLCANLMEMMACADGKVGPRSNPTLCATCGRTACDLLLRAVCGYGNLPVFSWSHSTKAFHYRFTYQNPRLKTRLQYLFYSTASPSTTAVHSLSSPVCWHGSATASGTSDSGFPRAWAGPTSRTGMAESTPRPMISGSPSHWHSAFSLCGTFLRGQLIPPTLHLWS